MQNLFSYPLKIEELASAPRHYKLKATEAQRAYIADVLKIADVKLWEADMTVQLYKKDHLLKVKGNICAELEMTSVISLDNFVKRYEPEFEIIFDTKLTPKDLQNMEFEFDDNVPDIIINGQIDLVEIGLEQTALVIDDFPRKDGEVFEFKSEFDEETTKQAKPFAALAKLKK